MPLNPRTPQFLEPNTSRWGDLIRVHPDAQPVGRDAGLQTRAPAIARRARRTMSPGVSQTHDHQPVH
eukprot:5796108-Lingulodinium_polyedra.AAC.1